MKKQTISISKWDCGYAITIKKRAVVMGGVVYTTIVALNNWTSQLNRTSHLTYKDKHGNKLAVAVIPRLKYRSTVNYGVK
jgi:hypothetical protein